MATVSPAELPGSVIEQIMRGKGWYDECRSLSEEEERDFAVEILSDIVESVEETIGFAGDPPWDPREPGWWKKNRKA